MSAPLILGTNSIKDTGYNVDNSLRFNGSGSDDYLYKTFGSDGNRKTYTVSAWVKRAELGRTQVVFHAGNNSQDTYPLHFVAGDNLEVTRYSGGYTWRITTSRVFRDVSAWYHIVVAVDTTQATASNRVKIYVNGVQESAFDNSSYPAQDSQYEINDATYQHNWGFQTTSNDFDYGGYMAECVFIDGSALDPTSFGEFDEDTGIWKPIDVSGLTFGTNGFYLDFEDSSALGNDISGNNNDFTVNNLTSIDQTTDTCTNNFATFLGVEKDDETSLSEGNLKATFGSVGASGNAHSSIAINNNGKWYAEFKMSGTAAYGEPVVGINDLIGWSGGIGYNSSRPDDSIGYQVSGAIKQGGTSLLTASTWGNNDIIQVAFDGTTGRIYFGKNGTWQNSGDPSAGTGYVGTAPMTSDYIGFAVGGNGGTGSTGDQIMLANFGNPPYSVSSPKSDADGYGAFSYTVPSGYYALNTKNLAEYG